MGERENASGAWSALSRLKFAVPQLYFRDHDMLVVRFLFSHVLLLLAHDLVVSADDNNH